eukprot:COSAG02_NODE_4748_length_5028_cov_2.319537_6_plen_207_part_00
MSSFARSPRYASRCPDCCWLMKDLRTLSSDSVKGTRLLQRVCSGCRLFTACYLACPSSVLLLHLHTTPVRLVRFLLPAAAAASPCFALRFSIWLLHFTDVPTRCDKYGSICRVPSQSGFNTATCQNSEFCMQSNSQFRNHPDSSKHDVRGPCNLQVLLSSSTAPRTDRAANRAYARILTRAFIRAQQVWCGSVAPVPLQVELRWPQ